MFVLWQMIYFRDEPTGGNAGGYSRTLHDIYESRCLCDSSLSRIKGEARYAHVKPQNIDFYNDPIRHNITSRSTCHFGEFHT